MKDIQQNYQIRLISEMLFINSTTNAINKYEDTQNLSREYISIFKLLQKK